MAKDKRLDLDPSDDLEITKIWDWKYSTNMVGCVNNN